MNQRIEAGYDQLALMDGLKHKGPLPKESIHETREGPRRVLKTVRDERTTDKEETSAKHPTW